MFRLIPLVLIVGCVRVEEDFSESVDSAGIQTLVVTNGRGDVTVRSGPEDRFDIDGTRWGSGFLSKKRANRNLDAADVGVRVEGPDLVIDAAAPYELSGAHLTVEGPLVVNADVVAENGDVWLEEIQGSHVVTADHIDTVRLEGEGDFYSYSDGYFEIWPYADCYIRIETNGDTTLTLPYGGPYNIQVFGSADYAMTVTDLGFDDFTLTSEYFVGQTGKGTCQIEVFVGAGDFTLDEST